MTSTPFSSAWKVAGFTVAPSVSAMGAGSCRTHPVVQVQEPDELVHVAALTAAERDDVAVLRGPRAPAALGVGGVVRNVGLRIESVREEGDRRVPLHIRARLARAEAASQAEA